MIVLHFLNASRNNSKQAGKPIITLKLNGGIASVANLNSGQTELQTNINKIRRITGKNFLELLTFILNPEILVRLLMTQTRIIYVKIN
tara:strand:- start:308 stop:571 length:264 start_codon:yes stop_codon:yes gene_type:complete